MAVTIPIISQFSDKGIVAAKAGLDNLRAKVNEAEGAFGKMKAGFGAAGDFIKANAATMAAGAGAAIAGFAIKAVGDFQDLAISVDKFRDATGLTLEQASKWTEYAGDIGIDAGAIQTAINKMNREASKGEDYFAKLGVEMKKHADGTYDPQGTFLEVIDTLKGMKDPADRAKLATQLLGKGWTAVADLISEGSDDILASLNEISGAKIINEDEVERAKEFRDAQDRLRDSFEELSLVVGENLIPILSDLLDAVNPVLEQSSKLVDILKIGLGFGRFNFWKNLKDINVELAEGAIKAKDASDGLEDLGDTAEDTDDSIYDLTDTWNTFLGKLSIEEQRINLEEDFQRATDAAWKAFAENTPESLRTAELALISAKEAAIDYIKKIEDVPTDWETRFMAAIDEGNLEQVRRMLDALAKDRKVNYIPVMPGDTPSETTGRRIRSRSSTGRADIFGPAQVGGERMSLIVNVAGSVTSEGDLIEAIRKGLVTAQRNGAQLVYSNV